MPTREQLESALIKADAAGNAEDAKALANALKSGQYDTPQAQPVPQPQQTAPQAQPYTQQPATRRSMRERIAEKVGEQPEGSIFNPLAQGATFGFADELAALPAAAIAKALGDVPEGVSFMDAYRGIRDEIRGDTQAYAEANPGTALAAEVAGGLLTGGAAARQAFKAIPAATNLGKVGTGALTGAVEGGLYGAGSAEEGGRLEGAAQGATVGAVGGAVVGAAAEKIGSRLADRALKARQIKSGSSNKDLAKLTVQGDKLIKDKAAKAAINQGFDEGFVQQVKTASPADKMKILKMVRMSKRALKDNRFASRNRINQVVGESLANRVNLLNRNMRQAADRLDDVANSLKGQTVDYSEPMSRFIQDLEGLDIKISDQGGISVDLTGSMIEGADDARQVLTRIMTRLANTGAPDAYGVHRMKRYIDNMVTYGKGQDKGLKGEVLTAVKRLRRNLDQKLDETFPEYNKVNTQYSDNRQALDMLQEAWGGKVNMFNESAPKQLGIQSRKLLSNYASGTNQLDAIENAERTITKYGGKLDDNIMDLVSAESALRSFMPQKMFNTLQGEIEKSGSNVLRAAAGDKSGIVDQGLGKIAEKLSGKSPEGALDALERLLKKAI